MHRLIAAHTGLTRLYRLTGRRLLLEAGVAPKSRVYDRYSCYSSVQATEQESRTELPPLAAGLGCDISLAPTIWPLPTPRLA